MADSDNKIRVVIEGDSSSLQDAAAQGKTGLADLGQQTGQATDKTKEFNIHGRAQFVLFSEINKIMPGLGTALHAAFAGPLGPIILAGIAIAATKNAIDGVNKSLDDAAAAAAQPFGNGIQNLAAAWDEARAKLGDYLSALDTAQAAATADPVKRGIDQEKLFTEARIEGIKKIIQALGEEEQARLRAEGAAPDQIAAAKARTQAQVAGLDETKQGAGVARLQEELAKRSAPGAQAFLDRQATQAAEDAVQANARAKSLQDEIANLRGSKDKPNAAQAELDRLLSIRESMDNIKMGKGSFGDIAAVDQYSIGRMWAGFSGDRADVGGQIAGQQAIVGAQKRRLGQAEAELPEADRRKQNADAAAAAAAAAGKENADRVAALPQQIGDQQKAGLLGNAESVIARGAAAEDAAIAGRKLSQDYIAAIGQLKALTEANGGSMAQIVAIITVSHQAHLSQQREITALQQKFLQLQSQLAATRNRP